MNKRIWQMEKVGERYVQACFALYAPRGSGLSTVRLMQALAGMGL